MPKQTGFIFIDTLDLHLKIYAEIQVPKQTARVYVYIYTGFIYIDICRDTDTLYRRVYMYCFLLLHLCSVSKVVLHAKIYNYIFNSRHKYIFVLNSWILESEWSSFLRVRAQDMTEKSKALAKSSILKSIWMVSRIFSFELQHF